MTIADQCAASFEIGVRTRGRAYFHQGRVSLKRVGPMEIRATVRGSFGSRYQITLTWIAADPEIRVVCTCPYYTGGMLCKHVWATLLAVDSTGWPPASAPATQGTFVSLYNAPTKPPLPTAEQERTAPWQRQFHQIMATATEPQKQTALYPGRSPTPYYRAWFVWNIEASLRDGGVVLDYYCQEQRKSGDFGKLKRQGVAPSDVPSFADPADQRLLQLLLGNETRFDTYGYYSSSNSNYRRQSCVLAPVLYDLLLPELCATNRFVWVRDRTTPVEETQTIRWDAGPPWRFTMRCEADDAQQCWHLYGQLSRDTEHIVLNQPVLLLASGLVLFPDRVCRFEAGTDFTWVAAVRQAGSLTIPYADREAFLQTWWSLPSVPGIDLPEALQLPCERLAPQGYFCVLRTPPALRDSQLYATFAVLYAGHQIAPETRQAGIVAPELQKVFPRDYEAEAALLQQLIELGVQRNAGYYLQHGDYNFAAYKLLPLTTALVQHGWVVEAEGVRIRAPGAFKLGVTSGVDWFELSGQFDFDGVSAPLPRLLEAVKRGERYILLDDGSKGILPETWLAKYGKFAELGETEGEAVRFRPAQALLLDALLAEQDEVAVDSGFQHWREKLRTFTGITPQPQPRTFRGKLRHYQEEGLGWLHFLQEFRLGGCLADDMGLGKTVQILALLESRRTRRLPKGAVRRPSLAVVPRSLVFNWLEEAARFTPRLRVLDYTGLGRAKTLAQVADTDLVITTYGTLRRDIVSLKDLHFDYAILDEAQAIKNAEAQIAKACRLVQADYRLALSGTPVENHLGEIWSLFEFLNPGMLGRSTAFHVLAKNGDHAETNGLAILAAGLRPFILRRTKAQVLPELPEKTEQTIFCDMPRQQRKLYDELREYYRLSLAQHIQTIGLQRAKIHVLEALLRLRQAACHPALIDPKRTREPSAKLEALLEHLQSVVAEGHKALIFSQFTSLLSLVRTLLDQQGIVYEYLDGRTRKRQERVTRFQTDPACPLFLISLKAGGHGLNLTAADYVFILDPWWNPAVEAQAVDRTHRIGQTRRVFAYRLICRNTVEEKILELQQHKRGLADAIVSADNSVMRHLTAEDLQLLLT